MELLSGLVLGHVLGLVLGFGIGLGLGLVLGLVLALGPGPEISHGAGCGACSETGPGTGSGIDF